MGQVVTVPEGALNYILYGDNTEVLGNYIKNQLETIPQAVTGFAGRVYDNLRSSYNYVTDYLTKVNIFHSLNDVGVTVANNYIVPLVTFEEFQTANPTMQRWVMASPEIKSLYLKQNIDGYSDTYVNVFGEGEKEHDYNYRRVMSGALVDIDEHTSRVSIYEDELYPGDRELDYHEKIIVRSTWDNIRLLMSESDFDFTCVSGEKVKINK